MSISGIDIRGPVPDPYSELSVVATASNEVVISRENLAYMDQDSNDDEVINITNSICIKCYPISFLICEYSSFSLTLAIFEYIVHILAL